MLPFLIQISLATEVKGMRASQRVIICVLSVLVTLSVLAATARGARLRVAFPSSDEVGGFNLIIANTASVATELTLTTYGADGTAAESVELDILAGHARRILSIDNTGLSTTPAALVITSSSSLSGFLILFGAAGGFVGIGAEQASAGVLSVPFVPSISAFRNELIVTNDNSSAAELTLFGDDETGAEILVADELSVPGNGVLRLDLAEVAREVSGAGIAALRLEASVMVSAYLAVFASDGFLLGIIPSQQPTAPFIETFTVSRDGADLLVEIAGQGFSPSPANNVVLIGSTSASVERASSTEVEVRLPAGTSGDLSVTVFGQQSNLVAFSTAPVIDSIDPNVLSVGQEVTIRGRNFNEVAALNIVNFGAVTATVRSATPTQLVASVPAGSTTGTLKVAVDGGESSAVSYTLLPVLSSLSPSSGPAGTAVTITGENFNAEVSRNIVTFNGIAGTVTAVTATTLSVTAPLTTTEVVSGEVVVISGGLTSNALTFTATPVITSLTPSVGSVGAEVTIVGSNFSDTPILNTVLFNARAGTVVDAGKTRLVVTSPNISGHTVNGDVTVTVAGLTSNALTFSGEPLISSVAISFDSDKKPSGLTISGQNFSATTTNNSVVVDGLTATVTAASATSLTVVLPANITLEALVVAVNGISITHTIGATISSITPSSGSANTQVEILGANFSTSQNTISIGATSVSVNALTSNRIVFTVPLGLSAGAQSVTVTANGMRSNTFTVQ